MFGSWYSTPLIPLGQVATFNLNSIKDRVVPIDGKIEIRKVCVECREVEIRLLTRALDNDYLDDL